ncbi:cupredoxin domain-containing protein [Caldinitratiruptor microaerophilus]|uniref:EfeO-type cupredoxin-like domain-containing protein n=1 Tax=Caldinitratiruptor microaerophilus TaxID=671077 RepID=A0AA35G962_9FIRM|nr:cupredoxin domain-containing protein [Caldinitratiruptor microaerophilus]BDG61113.1 hypothetical protein caldi_22030 [Caldinitratiruptor microaerophilus]
MTRKQRWIIFGGAAALVVAGALTLARAPVAAAAWGPGPGRWGFMMGPWWGSGDAANVEPDVFRQMGRMHAQVHGGDPEAAAQWMAGMHAAMWGGYGPWGSGGTDQVPDAPAQPGAAKVEVTATITEWKIEPAEIEVEAGKRLVLTVKNEGTVPHNFAIPELNLRLVGIAPGASRTVELNADEPGTYEFLCDIPGHAQLGQRGTLKVVKAE